LPDVDLKTIATAEPGVRVDPSSGAKACYTDRDGVPGVIVRNVGKGRTVYLNLHLTDYHRWRLRPPEGAGSLALFSALTTMAGIVPEYRVARPDGTDLPAVEIHAFVNGPARILGIQRNPQLRVGELGPPRYRSNRALQQEERVQVDLGARYAVYDIRAGRSLGRRRILDLTLDPWRPSLLALFPRAVRGIALNAPERARRGAAIRYRVSLDAPQPAAKHAYRIEVAGPDGNPIPLYSRNILAARGKASGVLHLALSDPPGRYMLTARDIATGKTARCIVRVDSPPQRRQKERLDVHT